MNLQHHNLAAGRWQTMSLVEQLGNIGSEVSRALSAKERGEQEHFQQATNRALELFDLTLTDTRWAGAALKEIARARETFCDFCFGSNDYGSSPEKINEYFLSFGVAARIAR